MDQSLSPKPEEKAANADQTPDAQPVPDEVAASEHEEAEQSPFEDQPSTHGVCCILANSKKKTKKKRHTNLYDL